MRPFHFRHPAVAAAFAVAAFCAYAQEQPAPPPPGLQQIDEGDESAITIRQPDTKSKITERRQGGQVNEIKVETGRSTYYLHPNEPVGAAMRGDAQSPTVRPAEWKVHEFDIGQPKDDQKNEQPEPVPATPAPAK